MVPLAGRLLFYRWPEEDASLTDAPWGVYNVVRRCEQHIVYFTIPQGGSRASNDPHGPEQGTACAQYNLSVGILGQAPTLLQLRLRTADGCHGTRLLRLHGLSRLLHRPTVPTKTK